MSAPAAKRRLVALKKTWAEQNVIIAQNNDAHYALSSRQLQQPHLSRRTAGGGGAAPALS